MKALSIRVRLTLWYGGVMAGILIALGIAVYLMLGHALKERMEANAADYYAHEMEELRMVLFTLLPAGLALAVVGGYWLAGRALAPVQRMTETARTISAQNLRERIEVAQPEDELGRLAQTLNSMIGRLEQSFDAIRQFTADASHELLTPLTAMRTEVEVALRSARSPEDYQRVLASVLEEVERIARLADSLLLLSREDAGAAATVRRSVRLDDLVREVAGHSKALAEAANVTLEVGELPECTIEGDPDRLRQVFFNLLDNAVKYNRPGGSIRICGRLGDQQVIIEVADTGVGIPAEELPRVFDRFYRVDKSRSRQMGGTGLGLSIVKALVENHGGRIDVESTPGRGSTFRVAFPLAS